MNENILRPEVQQYVNKNLTADVAALVLKGSPFPDITPAQLATQISGRKTAERKLPLWFENQKVIYPKKINLEQTSSQITAQYKASLVFGSDLIDLTGGLGVDTYFFSLRIAQVSYHEQNEALSKIASHNFQVLKADNIQVHTGDGIAFLNQAKQSYDWIYIDPVRRGDHGGKVFMLSQCTPDIEKHLPLMLKKADHILIKTSPLLDLKMGVGAMDRVAEIHIVAVQNEVKEVLWVLKNQDIPAIKVVTKNFKRKEVETFDTTLDEDFNTEYSEPLQYLYEPNAAIMKTQLFGKLASDYKIKKLHPNSHLFTSEQLHAFPGRRFLIQEIWSYSPKELKQRLKNKKANVTTRNFPLDVLQIRKQLKIREGGVDFLFFSTLLHDKKIVLKCQKV